MTHRGFHHGIAKASSWSSVNVAKALCTFSKLVIKMVGGRTHEEPHANMLFVLWFERWTV
jgi:hypothetical protein